MEMLPEFDVSIDQTVREKDTYGVPSLEIYEEYCFTMKNNRAPGKCSHWIVLGNGMI